MKKLSAAKTEYFVGYKSQSKTEHFFPKMNPNGATTKYSTSKDVGFEHRGSGDQGNKGTGEQPISALDIPKGQENLSRWTVMVPRMELGHKGQTVHLYRMAVEQERQSVCLQRIAVEEQRQSVLRQRIADVQKRATAHHQPIADVQKKSTVLLKRISIAQKRPTANH